jgi:PmbA protein
VARALARLRRAGADAGDALYVESDSSEARVRGDEIDFVKQARERTLGIRALVGGARGLRSAHTSTSDLAPASVDRLVDATVTLARATAEDPAAGLPDGGFAEDDPELGLGDPRDQDVPVEERIASARRAEAASRAVDARIVNSEGSHAASELSRVAYGNTQGFLGAYEAASHALSCEPIARQDGSLQRDSWWSVSRRLAGLEAPERVGRRAAERALRRLGARRVRTQEVPVLFDPVTAPSLLSHVAACVSGYAVYRETSFLGARMGERVASPLVTVVDDGRLPGGLGSRPFDGEGLPTRRTAILRAGRLESWLLDAYSARKLGLAPTGSAARGPTSAPTVAPTNLWLEPGAGTLEELVASTERGLLVTELIGMGFHPVTGDYSRGVAGLWIEGGEIVHAVEEVTIAGNLGEMLASVDAVAGDLVWLGRVASPSLRIAHMTVAGE